VNLEGKKFERREMRAYVKCNGVVVVWIWNCNRNETLVNIGKRNETLSQHSREVREIFILFFNLSYVCDGPSRR
jgi:hypothetical protein